MRTIGVLALAAVALVLAAGAPAARKNPCALVTAADAKAALGGDAGQGTQSSARVFDSCIYAKGKRTLSVKSREITRAGFDQAARHIPGTLLGVPGIGDVAWVYFVPNGVSLALWKNGTEVVVGVKGAGAAAAPIVRRVAHAAARRL